MTDHHSHDPERAKVIEALDAAGIPFFKGAKTEDLKAKLPASEPAAQAAPVVAPAPPEVVAEAPAPAPRRRNTKAPVEIVGCEVTKNGDGKICTGEWDIEANEAETYAKGEVFQAEKPTADELEDRGFVVIR